MTTEEKVKCGQLDMLEELDRICRKNNISYFLVGGSLIGAIRHDGFIPWDDDIDVGMLRKNYEKFIICCRNDLCGDFELFDWIKDENSPIPFLKLKIKGTVYKEKLSEDTSIDSSIYIDIFPYDNAPDNKIRQWVQGFFNVMIKKIILLKCGFTIDEEGGFIKKAKYLPLRIVGLFLKTSSWKELYRRNARKYERIKTKKTVSLGGSYSYKRELKESSLIKNTIRHGFENIEVSIPSGYDVFLKEVYGNYMELPPEDQQQGRHRVTEIELGSYKIRNRLRSSGTC